MTNRNRNNSDELQSRGICRDEDNTSYYDNTTFIFSHPDVGSSSLRVNSISDPHTSDTTNRNSARDPAKRQKKRTINCEQTNDNIKSSAIIVNTLPADLQTEHTNNFDQIEESKNVDNFQTFHRSDSELLLNVSNLFSMSSNPTEQTHGLTNDIQVTNLDQNRDKRDISGASDLKKCETNDNNSERETWGSKIEFLLAVIGFAVDLGNVWRFPYICYKNGGGAFLIPYFIMLLFLGLPLFYMELALGQFQRCGAITIWRKICPLFTGAGYGICLVATYVAMYYNTIIAWAVYFLFDSFRSEVPWAHCNNEWNTHNCISVVDGFNKSLLTNESTLAANEYFVYNVLEMHKSYGIEKLGAVKWSLALCLITVFIIVYFSLWKGIKSSGKAVWVTATFPYIVLFILLIRGATLPGALKGIIYYISPQWHRLLDINVWIDAAAQIFFSLGPGFGTLLALSSYNQFHNNCYKDALVTATINCMTSLLAGFVVFSVLGYMADLTGKEMKNVADEGPGLVFIVYPEAIATLGGSVFWSILFFLMLITLGLDSTFGGMEAVITAVCDRFPVFRKKRELFVLGLLVYCFFGGLATTTYGGQFLITLMDKHAVPVALLFICFIEAIAVNWFYGVQKLSNDIQCMLGFQPGIFWKICWVGVCPVFLITLFVLSIWAYKPPRLGNYIYPDWSAVIGWCITCSSIICIPIYIIIKFIVTPGSCKEKINKIVRPEISPRHSNIVYLNGTVIDHSTLNLTRDDHEDNV